MDYHKALKRQIEKYLNPEQLKDPQMADFLKSVSNYYNCYERDKKFSEHAFEVSEREYQKVVQDLKKQNELKDQSIFMILNMIRSLDASVETPTRIEEVDIVAVLELLETQIQNSKALEEALIRAKEAAEASVAAKSNFLSVMSHEIRTPLNAIVGSIHVLKEEPHLPEQERFINSLNISADNLLNLVNDILDFSKIEEGKISFSENEFSISELTHNIRQANHFNAGESQNTLTLMLDDAIPAFVRGDETRLGQILNNLVSNAIKFTKRGKVTIEISVRSITKEFVDLSFSVTDTGIGIDKAKQEQIFERFTQADSAITRQFGGSGLGLTIVKRLLQLQESDIYIESEPGKGSKFYFNLRFKTSSRTKESAVLPEKERDLSNLQILLVEDGVFNVMIAEKLLTNWNALVDVAENGEKAVAKSKEKNYDLILMDLQMPVMDGITATRCIRSFNHNIPIIALTASASVEVQQTVLESGMNDYISKPFNPDSLYSTISKYFSANS